LELGKIAHRPKRKGSFLVILTLTGSLNGILKTACVGDFPTGRVEVKDCVVVENIVLGDNTRNTVCVVGPGVLGCTVEVGPLLEPSANAVLAPEIG
jgi:hypothetical protein